MCSQSERHVYLKVEATKAHTAKSNQQRGLVHTLRYYMYDIVILEATEVHTVLCIVKRLKQELQACNILYSTYVEQGTKLYIYYIHQSD
jgi:hypothetical protein